MTANLSIKKERAEALPFDLVDIFLLSAQDHDQQRDDCRDDCHHRLTHKAKRIQAPNKAPAARWARVSSSFCMTSPFVALHTRGKVPKNAGFYLVACCDAASFFRALQLDIDNLVHCAAVRRIRDNLNFFVIARTAAVTLSAVIVSFA